MSVLQSFALAAVSLMASASVSARNTNQFTLSIVRGDAQTVVVGQALPRQMVVLLADANGVPLQGAQIYFADAGCFTFLALPCEFPGKFGYFVGEGDGALVITDASGMAVAPAYVAGYGAGAVGILVNVVPNETPYYFPTSYVLTHLIEFRLKQVAIAAPVPVPTLDGWFQWLLGFLLIGTCCAKLCQHGRASRMRDRTI